MHKPSRELRRVTWLVALGLVGAIVLYDATAYAVNAIVSHDLPILMEIAATEAASYTELGAILAEAAAITAQVKEYTTVAKAAWGFMNELRHLSWDQLKDAAFVGVNNAFPELGQIYGDVQDIRDLSYSDPRAIETLRGLLWANVYGPGIDYLHSGHDNMTAMAAMDDHRGRQFGRVAVRRAQAETWEQDCERISEEEDAEGACDAAANRAAIQSALMLHDLQETALFQLDAQERVLANQDRRELDRLYEYDRLAFDMRNYLLAISGAEECRAGECLSQQYGHVMSREVAKYRARHGARSQTLSLVDSVEEAR